MVNANSDSKSSETEKKGKGNESGRIEQKRKREGGRQTDRVTESLFAGC